MPASLLNDELGFTFLELLEKLCLVELPLENILTLPPLQSHRMAMWS